MMKNFISLIAVHFSYACGELSCITCMLIRLKENVCESGNENNDELNLHKANTTHF